MKVIPLQHVPLEKTTALIHGLQPGDEFRFREDGDVWVCLRWHTYKDGEIRLVVRRKCKGGMN